MTSKREQWHVVRFYAVVIVVFSLCFLLAKIGWRSLHVTQPYVLFASIFMLALCFLCAISFSIKICQWLGWSVYR